jgi:hypothetical protein
MELEWLILSDFAQIIGGKLYLQGGGWDRLTVNSGFPVNQGLGLAASFSVPWNETNQPGRFNIEVQTQDGAVLAGFGGEFKVGRPADHPPGQVQRAQLAANLGLELKEPGTYVVVAKLEDQEMGRVPFFVVPGPMLAMQRAAQGSENPPQG